MSHSCFIRSSIDGDLGCFHILVIVNNTAMNIGVLMFFQISVLHSLGYIPRSGIAGSKGRYIFNFLRYLYSAFCSGCTNLHSHHKCRSGPLSPHPLQHFFNLFTDGSHRCEMVSHCVVLICISLMVSDGEHLFICLLAICMLLLENCLFRSFAHF